MSVNVKFEDGRSVDVEYKTPAIEAVKLVENENNLKDILALKVNNEVKTYDYPLVKDSNIEFIKFGSPNGYRVYARTLKMVLHMALTSLFSNTNVDFISTINNDQYFIIKDIKLTEEKVKQIKAKMQEFIDKDLPITRKVVSAEEATVLYMASNSEDKLKNINNRLKSYITMYFCDGMYNNFYGVLAPSTGYIKLFDLIKYKDGALLVIPDSNMNIDKERKETRLYDSFIAYNALDKSIGIDNIGDLNDAILKNKINDVIQVSEAIQERKLVELVLDIEKRKNIKMLLIAGPSSSGKTTFAQKLGVQLKLTGYNPIMISMDNYFVERKDTPLDENGKYNFECVEALDINLFNTQMKELIEGKTVELPEFDFVNGVKKFNGKMLKLEKKDILIVEGIHALNPVLTKYIKYI